MPAKKILHVASVRWNSAIAEYALSSCRANLISKKEVALVCLHESPLHVRALSHEIKCLSLPSFSIAQVFQAKKIIDEIKPDVIITHGGPETVLFGLAAATKVPLVRVRGYGFEDAAHATKYFYDIGQLGVKLTVTPSQALKNQIEKVSKIEVKTVLLGVDENKYSYNPQSWESRKYADLLIFGRLDPVKGHKEFINIFSVMKTLWPRYRNSEKTLRLKIIGSPANLSNTHLEKYVTEAGLTINEDVIISNERVENVSAFMSGCVAGVVPSIGSEIICRVAEEFLLSGTPVVVSGVGSLNETLQETSFGMSYFGLDSEQAALQIVKYIADVENEATDVRGRRSVLAKKYFSLEKMAQAWNQALGFL